MSKKLLSEAQVRRFQALATIKPINEMAYNEEEKVEETYNEELVNEEEEEVEMKAAPEAADNEAEESDVDVELDEELVEKFMDAVETIQSLADALGGEVADVDGMDLDAKPDSDEPSMEIDSGDDEMLQEALSGIDYIPSQKEIVKTVAQRVAKRLNEAKQAQAKLDKALGKRK